jgi:hypothetical protein
MSPLANLTFYRLLFVELGARPVRQPGRSTNSMHLWQATQSVGIKLP